MLGNMGYLDGNLGSMDVGDENTGIPAAPTVEIRAIPTPNMSVIMPLTYKISYYGDDLRIECTEAIDAGSDGTISGLQLDTALRQNQLLEEMLMLCLLIHQHIDVEYSLELLETLMFLFSNSLDRLLNELKFVGLPATTDLCILQALGQADRLMTVPLMHSSTCIEMWPWRKVRRRRISTSRTLALMMNRPHSGSLSLTHQHGKFIMDRSLVGSSFKKPWVWMRLLRAGSDANDIPSPVTETVADDYSHMLVLWNALETLVSVNAGSMDATNTEVIEQVEELSNEVHDDAKHALDLAVEKCEEAGSVQCVALQALAKQGALLQQMGKMSALEGPSQNANKNQQNLLNTSSLFTENNGDLIHGRTDGSIPMITDFCSLREVKEIWDSWDPFYKTLLDIMNGNIINENVLALSQSMWSQDRNSESSVCVCVEISGYDANGFAGPVYSPLDSFAHLEITGSVSTSPCDLSVEEW